VVLGLRGGAAGRNPATSPAVLAGEAVGEGLGSTRVRFGCLLAVERGPATPVGGAGRWAPLGALLRRAGSRAWATSGLGSFGGS
jgi:hypothetical protein